MNDRWNKREHSKESEKKMFKYFVNRFNIETVDNSNLSHSQNDGMVYMNELNCCFEVTEWTQ